MIVGNFRAYFFPKTLTLIWRKDVYTFRAAVYSTLWRGRNMLNHIRPNPFLPRWPKAICNYLLLSLDRYSANILTAWSSGLELVLMSSRTTVYFLWNNTNPIVFLANNCDISYIRLNINLTQSLPGQCMLCTKTCPFRSPSLVMKALKKKHVTHLSIFLTKK